MPATPASASASRTSSSLKGLMIAVTIFIECIPPRGPGQHSAAAARGERAGRPRRDLRIGHVGISLHHIAAGADGAAPATAPSWPQPPSTPRGTPDMIDLNHIDDLARRLSSLVPPAMREGREEMQQNFKAVLQSGLSRLDLVTREEVDVQRAVLLRTREKLDAVEQQVEELEARLASQAAPQPH